MNIEKVDGLVVAPFTPMNAQGDINLEMIPSLHQAYVKSGIVGAFVNGSTGEGLSLTIDERKRITKAWSEVVSKDFKLLVHVGHTSLEDAKGLARHAASVGASGISIVGPYYMKPANIEDLVEFCAEVASSAPQTPFYYYHIPALTGVYVKMADFLEVASQQIPTLTGIKFTDGDLTDYSMSYNFGDQKYDLMYGIDELLICGKLMGAKGYVGSTYNLFPQLYTEIIDAYENGDLEKARELQNRSILFVKTIGEYGYSTAAKAVMKLLGFDCGPTRLPLKKFGNSQLVELEHKLNKIGFFDYAITERQKA